MVIHTPTLIDYIDIVKDAFSEGIYWNGKKDNDIRESQWERHRKKTCINKGRILLYCYKAYYITNGFQVLSIEEYYRKYKRCILKNILKEFV